MVTSTGNSIDSQGASRCERTWNMYSVTYELLMGSPMMFVALLCACVCIEAFDVGTDSVKIPLKQRTNSE
jgi:hypothetical protein